MVLSEGKSSVWYLDETSFQPIMRVRRYWRSAKDSVKVPLPKLSYHSITVLGAIHEHQPGVFHVAQATNKIDVIALMEKILVQERHQEKLPVDQPLDPQKLQYLQNLQNLQNQQK